MRPTYTHRAVELARSLHSSGWSDSMTTRQDASRNPEIAELCANGYRFIITTQIIGDGPVVVLAYVVYDDADDRLCDPFGGDGFELTGDSYQDAGKLAATLDRC